MNLPPTRTPLLTYGFPWLLLGGATGAALAIVRSGVDRDVATPAILVTCILSCIAVERWHPLDRRWSMTTRTFAGRDLPYLVSGLLVERGCDAALVAIAARASWASGHGAVSRWALGVQVVAAILAFDLLWYWYHRLAHRGGRLWRVHGTHHTPQEMYTLAHGVFHPVDQFVVRFVLGLVVLRLGGFSAAAIFVALVVIGTVGILSHANADLRLWAGNHLLVGPETHRVHHSADLAGNYGTATTLWDQVFGTFVYSPNPPGRLGLAEPGERPDPRRFLATVCWPFRRADDQPTSDQPVAASTSAA
jgi:hypothetical protein